jgi:hypothetical protein
VTGRRDAETTGTQETAQRRGGRFRVSRIGSVLLVVGALGAAVWLGSGCTWAWQFRHATRNCDRLSVRTGGLCHRQAEREAVLAEVRDAAKVRELAGELCALVPWPSLSCLCCGDITLEFYKAGELRVAVSVHHGQTLRWPGYGVGDMPLSQRGKEIVRPWVAEAQERWLEWLERRDAEERKERQKERVPSGAAAGTE